MNTNLRSSEQPEPALASKRSLKFAILNILANPNNGKHQHKSNILGKNHQPGALEAALGLTFDNQTRALASRAFSELLADNLIRPTYSDLVDPESWVEVTDEGRTALSSNALDDLDGALHALSPELVEIRDGAWARVNSASPDSLRQAAHSGRELITQVLHLLAPDEELRAQVNAIHSRSADSKITRKMRVRFAYRKLHASFSDSSADLVEAQCEVVDALYARLSAEAHRGLQAEKRDVTDLLHATEIALRLLLLS